MINLLNEHMGASGSNADASHDTDELESVLKLYGNQMLDRVDWEYGGFGNAPKFPRPVELTGLFHVHDYFKDKDETLSNKALEASLKTLEMMAKGGMHDHLGHGFARVTPHPISIFD